MVSEWQKKTWGELATLKYGKGLRGYQEATGTFRVFGTNGPIGWHDKPLCSFPSVIIGRKGAYRGIHFSPAPFFVIDTAFYLNPKDDFSIKWAYYELLTHDINSMDSGSAIPSTSRESFYQLPVSVPTKDEQRAIAHILGSLDDKIELNRKMNETLEAMARAIFKSWFVDFDPVRAKAKGLHTGLPKEISDLFPDSFEDSELGEIPKGWEVGTLDGVSMKPQYGFTASAQEAAVGPRFLRIKDINKSAWIDWTTVPYCEIKPKTQEKYQLQPGDIVIARMADPGHAALIEESVDAVFASYLIRFRPLNVTYDRYLQYWFRSDVYWSLVRSRQTGSTRANLNAKVLGAFPLLVPNPDLAESFKKHIDPIRNKVAENVKESNTLVALRDTLLPKLISGELRVPDAGKYIEETVR